MSAYRPYPKYKSSGVEWLGDVPEEWEVKPLKYAATLRTQKSVGRRKAIGLENIESWSGRFIETESEFEGEGVAVEAGDILFGKLRPYLAKAIIVTEPSDAVGDFHAMRPNRLTHTRFLLYQILSKEFIVMVDGSTFGSKMPRASWEFVGKMPLPHPPLPEQQQIASFLDRECGKLDALQAKQERLIELLKEKRQALISHAVTKGLDPNAKLKPSGVEWLGDVPEHWRVVALKHVVAQPIIDGPHESPQKMDEGIPFVSAEAISQGFIDFDKIWGYISREDHLKYSRRYKPRFGDILLVKLGATTGTPAIVETEMDFNIWVPLAAIRPKTGIEPRFIFHILRSDNLKRAYELGWTYGTQQTLGLNTISNLRISLPPLAEQRAIVAHLDDKCGKIDQLKAKAERAIALLKERRSALISAAVTGKIDVRDA
jgi:type I restriction enzyme S subunit